MFAERVYTAMDDRPARPCEQQIVVTHGFALTFVIATWWRLPVESLDYLDLPTRSGSIVPLREGDFFYDRALTCLGSIAPLNLCPLRALPRGSAGNRRSAPLARLPVPSARPDTSSLYASSTSSTSSGQFPRPSPVLPQLSGGHGGVGHPSEADEHEQDDDAGGGEGDP